MESNDFDIKEVLIEPEELVRKDFFKGTPAIWSLPLLDVEYYLITKLLKLEKDK